MMFFYEAPVCGSYLQKKIVYSQSQLFPVLLWESWMLFTNLISISILPFKTLTHFSKQFANAFQNVQETFEVKLITTGAHFFNFNNRW